MKAWVFVLTFASISIASPARGVTPAEVDAAIARGKAWLYDQQKDGNWEEVQTADAREKSGKPDREKEDQWGGRTAVVCYALLAAGEKPTDPRLKPALEFLKTAPIQGVYATAMRTQALAFLPQTPEMKQLMRRDADLLLAMMHPTGKLKGLYDYTTGGKSYSMSRSHYGVLGVWGAALAGTEVNNAYWQIVEESWIERQQSDGGWRYSEQANNLKGEFYASELGLTAAGVATLYVTQDFLRSSDGINCGTPPKPYPGIDAGMKFLAEHLGKDVADYRYPNATLYAIERVGLASGLRKIGDTDWYAKGAEYLVAEQAKAGSWRASGQISNVPNTAFSLIFLARGGAPMVMSKLNYAPGVTARPGAARTPALAAKWNGRPRDVANVSLWIGRQIERDLTWQSISSTDDLDAWHEAPVLYLSGSDLPDLDAPTKQKLKAYFEEGGLVLGNADCATPGFAGAFRRLGAELFPEYPFRELPDTHPIYTRQQFPRTAWKTKPAVLGLSNGVRELMLLVPQADAGKAWQSGTTGGKEELWQLAADVYLYAVDKTELRSRGRTHVVRRDETGKADSRIDIARIQYTGNWNPEPGGWRRLSNVLFNRNKLDLAVEPVKLAADALKGFKLAHLTGTTAIALESAPVAELKRFVDGGGVLVIDSAGGSAEFAKSVEALLPRLAAGEPKAIDLAHPLFSDGSGKITSVGWRSFATSTLGVKKDSPRVAVVEAGGKPSIIYSREDLSAGLVGNAVDGILGYDPSTATEMMARIVTTSTK